MNLLSNIELNEVDNAIDCLEATYEFLHSPNQKAPGFSWLEPKLKNKLKWGCIALHGAVYGFAVCALYSIDKESVLVFKGGKTNKKKLRRMKVSHFLRKIYFRLMWKVMDIPVPKKMRTSMFLWWADIVKKHSSITLKDELRSMKQLISFHDAIKLCRKKKLLTGINWNALFNLNNEARNSFMHFTPGKKNWVYSEWDEDIYAALETIDQLVFGSDVIKLTKEQRVRINFLVKDIWEMCGDSWYFHFPDQIVISRCARIHNATTKRINALIPIRPPRRTPMSV